MKKRELVGYECGPCGRTFAGWNHSFVVGLADGEKADIPVCGQCSRDPKQAEEDLRARVDRGDDVMMYRRKGKA